VTFLVFSKIIDVEVFFSVHVCENISWVMWNSHEATNDKKETRLCEVASGEALVKCFCSSYGVEEKTNFNTIKLCVGFLCLGKVIIIHFLLHT